MKVNLKEFFKSRRNKVIACGVVAGVILTGTGIFVNSHLQAKRQEELRIAEEKAEEEKKAKELEEKRLAEEKAKKEQEEKEKAKKEKEEKEKESKKAKVDERESKGYNGQSENKVVNNKTNNNNKNTNTNTNSKKNNNSNSNNNSNNNKNEKSGTESWQVEVEEIYQTTLGNSGMFFSNRGQAESWAWSQLEGGSWEKKGYNGYNVEPVKYNGKIGWTIDFNK